MSEPIISVSGLRGIVGDSLTPELAMRYICAFAAGLGPGSVVISRDGRATGRMLADAVRAGLCGAGRDVIDLDVAATPTTGVMVNHLRAAGGVQISASHNPPEYNGLKLFGPDGRVVTAAAGTDVLTRFRSAAVWWVPHDRIGSARCEEDSLSEHLRRVLAVVDADRIRARRFRVLLDANHGAGSQLGRRLLDELGCQTALMGEVPDGQFAHPPEPTADNLVAVGASVRQQQAAVGFCQDPDADRLALIDETGRYLGEEYTLAICLAHVLKSRPGPIVTNCATSRMARDIAAAHGAACHLSAVGEANVCSLMQDVGAIFGGEGNGGPIDPRVGYVRDSFVGMALTLNALAARNLPLSRLADELPRYEIVKTKIDLPFHQVAAALDRLERHFPDAAANRQDGLRLDWPRRWLLARASNTEPIVRIIAETESATPSRELCAIAARVMRGEAVQ